MIGFSYAVSTTSASFCYPNCSSWNSGAIVSGTSVMVAIADCVGLKGFSAFTQDTALSWDVDKLYSTIFSSINGSTGA